jgi:hypothetical protein
MNQMAVDEDKGRFSGLFVNNVGLPDLVVKRASSHSFVFLPANRVECRSEPEQNGPIPAIVTIPKYSANRPA